MGTFTPSMFALRAPGVYFESREPLPAITRGRTDVAGFVGISERGPLHTPVKVQSYPQFQATYGGYTPQGFLAYAVKGFFENGGQICWVVRVADPKMARPSWRNLLNADREPVLRVEAANPGVWARVMLVQVLVTGGTKFTLILKLPTGELERWRDLTLDPNKPRYVEMILNDTVAGSRLARVRDLWSPVGAPGAARQWPMPTRPASEIVRLENVGQDGLSALQPDHLSGEEAPPGTKWGLATLEGIDEVSVVAIPDIMTKPRDPAFYRTRPPRCDVLGGEVLPRIPPVERSEFAPPFSDTEIHALQRALIAHCSRLKDRMAILDPLSAFTTPEAIERWRGGFDAKYAAVYYPWLRVADPLALTGLLRPVPPSGHIAGIYARSDLQVGVHKPPANERVEFAEDAATAVDEIDHARLNHGSVNVIRSYPGRGLMVAGARTLSRDPEWRYVNVRRLLIMIEEAIDENTQWTVFEPNNPRLWSDLERTVRSFLDRIWRAGMLDGSTADDAYFARCDETTNPPEETDQGRMICLIGVRPPWPAEFVVVRIGKTETGVEILETNGG